MNYLLKSVFVFLFTLPAMCCIAEIIGKGILVAKVMQNGKPTYVIGNVTNRKPPLEVFLKSSYVSTNLAGVALWAANTNLDSSVVVVATAEMFNPDATNVVELSASEWQTIFHRKPNTTTKPNTPNGNRPKN